MEIFQKESYTTPPSSIFLTHKFVATNSPEQFTVKQ